jgi:hypothetical protein
LIEIFVTGSSFDVVAFTRTFVTAVAGTVSISSRVAAMAMDFVGTATFAIGVAVPVVVVTIVHAPTIISFIVAAHVTVVSAGRTFGGINLVGVLTGRRGEGKAVGLVGLVVALAIASGARRDEGCVDVVGAGVVAGVVGRVVDDFGDGANELEF